MLYSSMYYTSSKNAHLRSELVHFLSQTQGDALAVTFTLKQSQRRRDGTYQHIRMEDARQNVKHFLKMLNRKCYGRAYTDFKKSLNFVTAFEQGTPQNPKKLHVHMLLYLPDYASTTDAMKQFKGHITRLWRKTSWSYHEYTITPAEDKIGWLEYITKEGMDAVDLSNTVIHSTV
jgi:hypothetical protein